jgi:predicted MFS family arabinose efflux permease
MGARLLLALSAATFMPAAGGYAAALGGPERQGRALSMVVGGLTVAIIAGVPLGVLLGDALGWRATFLGVGGLAAFSLLGILAWLPRQAPGNTASLGARLALAGRADVLSVLAVTVLTVASTFTVYTYLGVFMQAVTGLGPRGLAAVLLAFGVASAAGTRIAGSAADHWGARRTVIWGCGLVLLAYLALALGAALEQAAMAVLLPAIVLWGFASWGVATAQQARLVALAPDLAPVSLSLNSSAIYLGSAMGAAVGALVVADGAVRMLGGVAACFSLASLLTVLASARKGQATLAGA